MNKSDDNVIKLYNEILEEACQKGAGQTVKNYEEYEKMPGSASKRRVKDWLAVNMSRPEFQEKIEQLNSLMGTSTAFRDKKNKIEGRNEREKVEKFLAFGESLKPKAPVVAPSAVPAPAAPIRKEEEEKDKEKEKEEVKDKDKKDDERKVEKLKGKAKKSLSDSWKSFKKRVSNASVWLSLASAVCFAISASVSAPAFTLVIFGALPAITVSAKTASWLVKRNKLKKAKLKRTANPSIHSERREDAEATKGAPEREVDLDKIMTGKPEAEKEEEALVGEPTGELETLKEELDKAVKEWTSKMADFSKGTISKNEMQNYKLNVEELKDKVRRFNPLKNGADLEFLNKELATENNRLNFWNNNQRESAINATKERISLIEGRVRSLKNTENMYNLDSKQLNYLNQKFDDEVKKYPNMNVSKPQEILDLRQEVINGYNTKMIITSKTKLMQQLKANLALVSSDSEKQYLESQIAELQEDIDRGLPMNNTRRLRELNRAKEVATSQGRMDIVAEYIKEIKEIEANYDASNQEEDMKKWAMDRVIELQKSEIIADRVGDRHIIKNYQREIEDLKAKYNLTLTTPELEDINRYKPYEMTSETNKDDKAREEAMNYYRKMGLFPETEKEGKSK